MFQSFAIGYGGLKTFSVRFKELWPGEPLVYYGVEQCPGMTTVRCTRYAEWDWGHWFGEGLRSILDDMRTNAVAIFLVDRPVPARGAVADLATFMDRKPSVLRGDFGPCQGKVLASYRSIDLVEAPLSFNAALWNRQLLHDLLEPSWGFEEAERKLALRPNTYSVGAKW